MARNEERDCSLCSKVSGVLASEGRTSEDGWTPSTFTDSKVDMGAHHLDFMTALPRSPKGNNIVWVIVDCLTKSAHFIPFRLRQSTELLAKKYLQEMVRLHDVSVNIVSNRDTRFLSHFWRSLQKSLGTRLKFNTAYHPQTMGNQSGQSRFLRTC